MEFEFRLTEVLRFLLRRARLLLIASRFDAHTHARHSAENKAKCDATRWNRKT